MNLRERCVSGFLVVGAVLASSPLEASVEVRGKVTAEGRPVPGVEVSIAPVPAPREEGLLLMEGKARPEAVETTRSGADGRFRLSAPEPGPWSVRASKEGYAPMVFERPLLEDTDLPVLELVRERGVEVHVTAGGGSGRTKGVAGARVLGVGPDEPWYREPPEGSWRLARQVTRTDGEGRATVSAGDREEELTIAVAAPGFVPESVTRRLGRRLQVRLIPPEPRAVRVVDHRRRPAPGVVVWHGEIPLPVGVTGEAGHVTLFDAGDSTPRFRFLGAGGAALQGELPEPREEGDAEDSGDGGGDGPPAVLLDPPRYLEGRVLSMPHREPVAGALVWRSGAEGAAARSGPRGTYRLTRLPWVRSSLLWGAPGFFVDRMRSEQVPRSGPGPTLVLNPAGAVVGTVVDAEGRPVEGVAIRTRFDSRSLPPFTFNPPDWQKGSGGVAVTGRDGRFRLGNLVPGLDYELRFAHDGYASRTLTARAPAPGSVSEELRVALQRGLDLRGRVLDQDDEPVAGAAAALRPARPHDLVDRMRRMKDPPPAFRASTAEDGVFRFTAVPPATFDLGVEAPGFASVEIRGIDVQEHAQEGFLGTVVMEPEALVRGRVESADGEPLGGVAVRIVPDDPFLTIIQAQTEPTPEARSAGDGWFELGGLRPGESVTLRFDRDGFETGVLRNQRAGVEPVTVSLEPTRTLTGTVVGPRGSPVPEAIVIVEESLPVELSGGQVADAGLPVAIARTDDDGEFRIEDVSGDSVNLQVRASGWQDWDRRVHPWGEEGDGSVEVVLQPAAVLEGSVFGPDGQPVVGAEVREWAPELPEGSISYRRPLATTDGDGRYRIDDLAPGPARLEARHPASGRAVREIEAQPGDNALDFQLEGGPRVTGRVVGPDGSPVAGARVALTSKLPSWSPPTTRSDGGGRFAFEGVSSGRYELRAEKAGMGRSAESVSFEVREEPVEGLEVQLAPLGTVSGRLFGLSADDLERVRIHAGPLLDVGRVDFEGYYEIPGLLPGEWTVAAEVPGSDLRATGTVRLEAEDPEAALNLDFDASLALTGQVLLGGEPAPGLDVTVHGPSGPVGWATTDGQGSFLVNGLPRGEYRIQIRSSDRSVELERSLDLDSDRSIQIRSGSPGPPRIRD